MLIRSFSTAYQIRLLMLLNNWWQLGTHCNVTFSSICKLLENFLREYYTLHNIFDFWAKFCAYYVLHIAYNIYLWTPDDIIDNIDEKCKKRRMQVCILILTISVSTFSCLTFEIRVYVCWWFLIEFSEQFRPPSSSSRQTLHYITLHYIICE